MMYSLNFHQSFAPEKEAIAQIVQFASKYKGFYSKEDISVMTSIPTGEKSGKVIPHIFYSEAMDLVNVQKLESNYSLTLTSLGEVVCIEDPYLIEDLTQWLCHYNLAYKNSPAQMWSFIFNSILTSNGCELSNSLLTNAISRNFDVNKINLTPFRSSYITEKSFGNIKILDIKDDKYIFKRHEIERSFKFLYAYLLISCWEKEMPNQSEITFDNLIVDLGFSNPFIWNENTIMEVLEILQEERVIVINRQLSPITLIKQVSTDVVLSKMYSLLI
jgi:Protein of unknown function (DUF4007)